MSLTLREKSESGSGVNAQSWMTCSKPVEKEK